MDRQERKLYNSWSKEQIYEAYLLEYNLRQQQKKEITALQHKLAFVRFNLKKIAECVKALKTHFKSL